MDENAAMKRKSQYLPKIVMCVVGNAELADQARPILEEAGLEHEFRDRYERMADAFEASSSGVWRSLTDEDLQQIEKHQRVLYVLSENFNAEKAAATCHRFLRLGRELLEAGATGLKYESGGVAHSKPRWLALAEQADRGYAAATSGALDDDDQTRALMDFWGALIESYVQMPIVTDEGDHYSCGMHLLGQPDAIVSAAIADQAFGDSESPNSEIVNLFFMLAYYLLAECPDEGLRDGHTFRMHDDSPRFRLQLEDCTGYDADEFFFNPYGRWRFAEIVDMPYR